MSRRDLQISSRQCRPFDHIQPVVIIILLLNQRNMRLFGAFILLILLFISASKLFKSSGRKSKGKIEVASERKEGIEAEILDVVDQIYEAVRKGDASGVGRLFFPGASINTFSFDGNISHHSEEGADQLTKLIGAFDKSFYDEITPSYNITIKGDLAIVIADCKYYIQKNFSHCGMNVFQIIKTNDGWKIFHISDTRKTKGCEG